jgi:hypothetical protein
MYFFIQHRNDDYSNALRKFEKGNRGSEKLFPLFPFSNLFYFFILSSAKVSKNKYAVEKEKRKWWIWGERENSNANGGRRVEKKMG